MFHPEPVPSAVTRYENEVVRVLSVLDGVLSKPGFQWLNGDKVTIADITVSASLMFSSLCREVANAPALLQWISWNSFAFAALLPDGYDVQERLPALWDWHQRLIALPYVVAGLQEKEELGGA